MQEKDDKEPKHPTEMTSDELLDYVLASGGFRAGKATSEGRTRSARLRTG